MDNLQLIKSNQQSKYDEIIKYLKQDNGYWLENDKWDLTEEFFTGKKQKNYRYLDFSTFKNVYTKNEVKYFVLYSHKNNFLKESYIGKSGSTLKRLGLFLTNETTFINSDKDKLMNKLKLYLTDSGIKLNTHYHSFLSSIMQFTQEFYDDREETEKDVWYSKNIKGAKIPASGASHSTYTSINFNNIPIYYREDVKRYFKTIITKKSWSTCNNTLKFINYFFNYFYSNGYDDGFVENLNRNDIEKYLYHIGNNRKDKNRTETSRYISFIRTFLEYIQISQYDKAPKKEVSFLIFQDDIPKREFVQDEMRKIKFIPDPILKQLDNNIMYLDRP